MFEVRTPVYGPAKDDDGKPELIEGGYTVETRRTSEKVAKEDVSALALFGKKAWIVDC